MNVLNHRALKVSINETDYFSSLMIDYKNRENKLDSFYNRYPLLDNFQEQIQEKQSNYSKESRTVLVQALRRQYENEVLTEEVDQNLALLAQENAFTITTGHQLNIFTGPLYFWYKIINVIKLCDELKLKHPKNEFIPIYWMASEDHDFDEIHYFNFRGRKLSWDHSQGPAVGHLDLNGFEELYKEFDDLLGNGQNADELRRLFKESYFEKDNLSAATHHLVHELFKDKGLLILDGDDRELKRLFSPVMKDDLLNHNAYQQVNTTIDALKQEYKIQVNPREINLFYLQHNNRSRIVRSDSGFELADSSKFFTQEELLMELESNPERFSPNVVLRPLYQESILPNLAYIGGGGEIAYWFELKGMFDQYKVSFPMLILRNSLLILNEKQIKKAEKLDLDPKCLLRKKENLIDIMLPKYSSLNWDFSEKIKLLERQFQELFEIANQTDKSFNGAVAAQEKKQINGLKHLEKRLKVAEKRRLYDKITRLESLHEQVAPNDSLEERQRNFSIYYEQYGSLLYDAVYEHMDPLAMELTILIFDY
ncbi:bacillithiol biosynthesis cysteine-adding enzyme BshC [Flavobacteriaceae bacterium]|nr:bacillithiol biosynthesis cysteine-adding enzyme BshC [Flavobacteriaceae bacterium]